MYAQLGDIKFEALIGYDSLSIKHATGYNELELVSSKNTLQPSGEALKEVSFTISFHKSFCVPEIEIEKLNNARKNRDVLSFIYGNGVNKGNYVITELLENILQTSPSGDYISANLSITLKEYVNEQLEQDKTQAFAVNSNRPLPINIKPIVSNPALAAMNENKNAQQLSNSLLKENEAVNTKINLANSAPPISKAQAFINQVPIYVSKNNALILKCQTSLTGLNNLLSQYSALLQINPLIPAVLSSCQSALSALQNQNSLLSGLPTTINDVNTANFVLNEMLSTTSIVMNVNNRFKDLNEANSTIAIALATKKNLN